jgi:hypothetical protein
MTRWMNFAKFFPGVKPPHGRLIVVAIRPVLLPPHSNPLPQGGEGIRKRYHKVYRLLGNAKPLEGREGKIKEKTWRSL